VHGNARLNLHGRRLLIARIQQGRPIAHVADELGILRQTAYKWWARLALRRRRWTVGSLEPTLDELPTSEALQSSRARDRCRAVASRRRGAESRTARAPSWHRRVADLSAALDRERVYVPPPATAPVAILATRRHIDVCGGADLGWAPLLRAGWVAQRRARQPPHDAGRTPRPRACFRLAGRARRCPSRMRFGYVRRVLARTLDATRRCTDATASARSGHAARTAFFAFA
jgi:hypothetical protein